MISVATGQVVQDNLLSFDKDDEGREVSFLSPEEEFRLSLMMLDGTVQCYDDAGEIIKQQQELQAEFKELMYNTLKEMGKDKVRLPSGRSVSIIEATSYPSLDTKKVLVLCEADEELAEQLEPFMVERTRKEHVRVG